MRQGEGGGHLKQVLVKSNLQPIPAPLHLDSRTRRGQPSSTEARWHLQYGPVYLGSGKFEAATPKLRSGYAQSGQHPGASP